LRRYRVSLHDAIMDCARRAVRDAKDGELTDVSPGASLANHRDAWE